MVGLVAFVRRPLYTAPCAQQCLWTRMAAVGSLVHKEACELVVCCFRNCVQTPYAAHGAVYRGSVVHTMCKIDCFSRLKQKQCMPYTWNGPMFTTVPVYTAPCADARGAHGAVYTTGYHTAAPTGHTGYHTAAPTGHTGYHTTRGRHSGPHGHTGST